MGTLGFSVSPLAGGTRGAPGAPDAAVQAQSRVANAPQTSGWMSPAGVDQFSISLRWLESTDSCFGGYSIQYYNPTYGHWQGVTYGLGPRNQTSYWEQEVLSGVNEWELIDIPCSGPDSYYYANFTQPSAASLTCTVATSTSIACSWDNNARYGGLLQFQSYELFEEHTPLTGSESTFPVTTITTEGDMSYLVQGLTPGDTYGFYLNTTDACTGSWVCDQVGGSTSSSLSIVNPFVLPGASSSSNTSSSSPFLSGVGLGILIGVVLAVVAALAVVAYLRPRRGSKQPPATPTGSGQPDGQTPPRQT